MIYLVRHGQTAGNKAKRLQGRGSDDPLNDAGRAQAENVRGWFKKHGIVFARVYASPLQRAVQTAGIIAGSCSPVLLDERLLEMDYGPYEGMDLTHPAPEVMTFFSDFVNNPAPPGMEPLPDVTARLGGFLEAIRPEAEKGNLLIATHAIAMKGALEYLTPESGGRYWSKYIANGAVYAFDLRDGSYTVPAEVSL